MAQEGCFCGTGGVGNLGLPNCTNALDVVARLIFMDTYDNDGNENSIKESDLVDGKIPADFFNAKLIEPDPSKRWYITDKLFDEVELTNSDRTTQTTSSGAIFELLKGQTMFTGKQWGRPAAYSGQLNTIGCGEKSVYFVDIQGGMGGETSKDGTRFLPMQLQEGSVVSQHNFKTDTSKDYVSLDFQLDRIVSLDRFLTLPASAITENLKKAESLIDVKLVATDGATQSITTLFIDANYSLYGTYGNLGAMEGKLALTSWDIDGVNPTAVVESSEGVYELTVANTSPAIVKYVEERTLATIKGYESNELTITYP